MALRLAFFLAALMASAVALGQYFQGDPTRATCIRVHQDYNLCEHERVVSLLRVQKVQLSAGQPLREYQPFWCDQNKSGFAECGRAVQRHNDAIADAIARRNTRVLEAAQRERERQRDEERFRETVLQINEGSRR